MVDTRDLKSLGHYGCVGSSPTSGTTVKKLTGLPIARLATLFFDNIHTIIMNYNYITSGTCSRSIEFEITDDGKIGNVVFNGGCHGNLQGIAALVKGMTPEEAISRLEGIDCRGKGTSCPDQFAKALRKALS